MSASPQPPLDTRPLAERRRDELPALEAAGYLPFPANGGLLWVLNGLKVELATGDWFNDQTEAAGKWPDTEPLLKLFKRQLPQLPPLEQRIADILRDCALETRPCRYCGAKIHVLLHQKTGAKTPYSMRGVNHYLDCQDSEKAKADYAAWRKSKK